MATRTEADALIEAAIRDDMRRLRISERELDRLAKLPRRKLSRGPLTASQLYRVAAALGQTASYYVAIGEAAAA